MTNKEKFLKLVVDDDGSTLERHRFRIDNRVWLKKKQKKKLKSLIARDNGKVPRKKKKKIPNGTYCYTPTSDWKDLEDGRTIMNIKYCPFYKYIEVDEGHCRFLNSKITQIIKECKIKNKINSLTTKI